MRALEAITTLAAMPGTIRLGALLALLTTVAVLSGCGSDEVSGEIPADKAPALRAALEGVSTAIATDCVEAQQRAQEFEQAVNALPQDPSGELKPPLQDAAKNLRTLVDVQCAAPAEPGTTPSTATTTPTSTTPTTSSTETTSTETTSTDTGTTSTGQTEPPGNGPPGGEPPGNGPPDDGGTGGTGSGGTDG